MSLLVSSRRQSLRSFPSDSGRRYNRDNRDRWDRSIRSGRYLIGFLVQLFINLLVQLFINLFDHFIGFVDLFDFTDFVDLFGIVQLL